MSSTDTTLPKLVSSNPANGEQNVPINQRTVSFTFNEAMRSDISVTTWVNDSADPDISSHDWSHDYEWSLDQRTVTFTYNKNLPRETTIIWYLNPSPYKPGFNDISGNPLPFDKYSGEFRTCGIASVEASSPINHLAGGTEPDPVMDEAIVNYIPDTQKKAELLTEYSTIYSYYADISENAEGEAPYKSLKNFENYNNNLQNDLTTNIEDIPVDALNPFSDLVDATKIILSFKETVDFLYKADFLIQLSGDEENSKILQDISPKLRELSQISKDNPDDVTSQKQLIAGIRSDLDIINYEKYKREGVDAEPVIIERTISDGGSFTYELELPPGTQQINYKDKQKEDYTWYGFYSSPKYEVSVEDQNWRYDIYPEFIGNPERSYWSGYDHAISWAGSWGGLKNQNILHLTINCIDVGGDMDLKYWKIDGPKSATVTIKFVFEPDKSSYWGMGEFLKNYKDSLSVVLEKHEILIYS